MYCYYTNKASLNICFSNNILYLPYTIDSELQVNDLLNQQIVIYYTNPIRIYGYATVIKCVSYFDSKDAAYHTSSNKVYNKLISIYNMAPMENIAFFKIDKIHTITPLLQLTDLNNFLIKCNKINKNISIPGNKTLFTINVNNKSLIEFIDSFELHTKQSDTESESESESESDSETQSETESEEEEEEKLKQYCIPILWSCCENLITLINNSTIKKKDLKHHYSCCDDCEINNNNDDVKNIDLNKCRLGRYDKKDIKHIIKSYARGINLQLDEKDSNKLELSDNIVSLFYNEKEEDVYDKCIFIVKTF